MRYLIFILLLLPSICLAQPSVDSVTGTVSHGESITIGGSSFGTKSPAAPLIWDDGEDKTNNSPSHVRSEGGWDDIEPNENDPGGTATDSDYFAIQYRAADFRDVAAPHDNSDNYIAGGPCQHEQYNPNDSYDWIASENWASDYKEYYLDYPTIPQSGDKSPTRGWIDYGSGLTSARWSTTVGSLSDHTIAFGTQSDIEYDTVFIRDESGDPDTTDIDIRIGGLYNYTKDVGVHINTGTPEEQWFVSYYHVLDPDFPAATINGYANLKVMQFDQGCGTPLVMCGSPQVFLTHPSSRCPSVPYTGNTVGADANTTAEATCGENSNTCVTIGGDNCFDNYIYEDQDSWIKFVVEYDEDHSVEDFFYWYVEWDDEGTAKRTKIVSQDCSNMTDFDAEGVSLGIYHCVEFDNGYYWNGSSEQSLDNGCNPGNANTRDEHPDMFKFFDDVYIDNSIARVVLANNATYSSATIVEPQIPSAWAAGEITATVNQGKLPDGEDAYLFVFDSDNTANGTGYTVTFGEAGSTNTLEGISVTGVSIQ